MVTKAQLKEIKKRKLEINPDLDLPMGVALKEMAGRMYELRRDGWPDESIAEQVIAAFGGNDVITAEAVKGVLDAYEAGRKRRRRARVKKAVQAQPKPSAATTENKGEVKVAAASLKEVPTPEEVKVKSVSAQDKVVINEPQISPSKATWATKPTPVSEPKKKTWF